MKQLSISAEHRKRTGTTKCGQLRREGKIPAVIYGKSGSEAIKVDGGEMRRLMRTAAGSATLINITIDNGTEKLAIIQDIERNRVKDTIMHVDFHELSPNEQMHAVIPVHAHGQSEGVKAGGIIDIVMHSLDIHCLPKHLPESIELDVTALNIGDAIHVKELPKMEGVTINADADAVLITCVPPKLVVEEEPEVEEGTEGEAATEEGEKAEEPVAAE